jgi:integrase
LAKELNIDRELLALNASLKAMRAGVAVNKPKGGDRLYLRATLPAKPGSGKTGPHQQRIALGVYANAAGLKRAKAEAMALSHQLAMGQFKWADWIENKAPGNSVGEWVEAFRVSYLKSAGDTPTKRATWESNYHAAYRKLDWDRKFDPAYLKSQVEYVSQPDTKTRLRVCLAFRALVRFAGAEDDYSDLIGGYSASAVDPRNLPSDEEIEAARETIQNPKWQFLFGLMACYGLRNHEPFFIHPEDLAIAPGAVEVYRGKSVSIEGDAGIRKVWPLKKVWWEEWELYKGGTLPNVETEGRENALIGKTVSRQFKRLGLWTPYTLRHCWAARAAASGLQDSIAAKMMGHSLNVHYKTYLRFLDEKRFQSAWDKAQD